MKIEEDIATTRIIFTDDDSASVRQSVPASLHKGIGVMKQGAKYAPSFKRGVWDGYIDFYDKKTQTFPTGLLPQVVEVLHKLQQAISFQFTIEDIRPELYVTKVPPVVLHDDKADIKLYEGKFAYQQEAINQIFQEGSGIINASTNAGKCLTGDTYVLTSTGYKTMNDLIKEYKVPTDTTGYYKPNKRLRLINGYGNAEDVGAITVNGVRDIKEVVLANGIVEKMTNNHPIRVVSPDDGSFVWKKAEELTKGYYVVSAKATQVFGKNRQVSGDKEAYALGLLVADGYFGQPDNIVLVNDQSAIIEDIIDYFRTIGKSVNLRNREGTPAKYVYLNDKQATGQLHNKFDIPYGTAETKEIPKQIMQAPKHTQIAFISGYLECECSLDTDKLALEVTSKSAKLITQLQILLLNLGYSSRVSPKLVKKYPDNKYVRLTVGAVDLVGLLKDLTFHTEQRKQQSIKIISNWGNRSKHSGDHTVPYSKYLLPRYLATDKHLLNKSKYTSLGKAVGATYCLNVVNRYSGGDSRLLQNLMQLCNNNYSLSRIVSITDVSPEPTYDFSMPKTHSFIANGIINHNTEIAAGAIKTILPELKRDERVLFLTNSSVIFNQTIKRLETRLQIPVGAYGGGKHSIKQVTVCTVQTIAKGLDIDPEAKVKLTAKENMTKRIAKRVAPQFMRGANLLMAYKSYLKFFRPETKVDQQMQAILEDIRDECGTDAELGERMRQYVMDYEKIIKTKNKDAYKKHQEAIDLLESAQMLIEDECHHAKSDTFYRIGIGCKNALYRIGLSGTIDKEDEMAWQRLQALFHKIIIKVSNDDLIGKGISAKPKVSIVPIMVPHKIKTLKPYAEAYTQGIVTNKFRNNLIASVGASWAVHGKATLIIVNQIAQGEIIGDYLKHPLKGKPTDYEFLTGPESQDEKDRILNRIKSGDCLVMIATSLVDEGLDVSNFRALVMAAGGKSMRQVLQRVGRVLRKKKVGPNKCDVIDFYDEQNNFLLEHSKERIKLYKNEGFELNWVGGEK